MSISSTIKLFPEPLRSLGFASIGAGYMGIGTALDNPSRILHIQNLTDATLLFSFNGIDDHEVLPANAFLLLDLTANRTTDSGAYIAAGTRIYVKQSGVATSGSVYVASFYGLTN